jgi:hypothetical protein
LGQITRAYYRDGALRFDALDELSDRYDNELFGLSWDTVYKRPDLQLRALVLMSKDMAAPFRKTQDQLAFGDAAYNGGLAGVQKERRACKLTKGCDPNQWFGHVELHCLKSKAALYGDRSACEINREHVQNVLLIRRSKYAEFML